MVRAIMRLQAGTMRREHDMAKRNSRKLRGTHSLRFDRTRWLWLAGIGLVAAAILVVRLVTPHGQVNPDLRAAFIDQLSPAYPNEDFRSALVTDVERFGLPLDVYEGEQVDVDLYRGIAEKRYGVLVIRSHSGVLETGGAPDSQATALFTNEPYARYKHVAEQVNGRLLIVRPFEGDRELTFGVTDSFFQKSMRGELPGAVVVVAGCSILGRTDLARALVERGASVVISWDRSVGLEHVDRATGLLLYYLLGEGLTVDGAVFTAMAEAGPDPEFGSVLTYYPASAGSHTVEDLLIR